MTAAHPRFSLLILRLHTCTDCGYQGRHPSPHHQTHRPEWSPPYPEYVGIFWRQPNPELSSVSSCWWRLWYWKYFTIVFVKINKKIFQVVKYLRDLKVQVELCHALPTVVISPKCFAVSLSNLPFVIIINHLEYQTPHGYSYLPSLTVWDVLLRTVEERLPASLPSPVWLTATDQTSARMTALAWGMAKLRLAQCKLAK